MSDNDNKVKTTKPPKSAIAKHNKEYSQVAKTWTETVRVDGKEKIVEKRRLKNGVVKSSLKEMYKAINGRRTRIC